MARDFNGTTDRIDFASPATLTGSAVTISAWVYSDGPAGNADYILCLHCSGDTSIGLVFSIASSTSMNFYRAGSIATLNVVGTVANSWAGWVHLLATHDGTFTNATTVHIYRNGTEVSYPTQTNGNTEAAPSGSWSIGGRIFDDNRNLDGKIAFVGVWNRVLDAGEIAGLAAGNIPDTYSTNLIFSAIHGSDYSNRVTSAAGTLDGTGTYADPPHKESFILAGTINQAGALVKSVKKTITGAIAQAGNLAQQFIGGGPKSTPMTLTGSSAPTGAVTKSIPRTFDDSELRPTGPQRYAFSTAQAIAGAVASSGVFARLLTIYLALAGAVTSSGAVVKSLRKTIAGALTSSGILTRANAIGHLFRGVINPSGVLPSSATLHYGPTRIAGSADDASEVGTVVSLTANPLANCDTVGTWNGWIFRGINIPQGATILSAYMTLQMTGGNLDEPDVRIYGLDTAAPANFTAAASNISSRTRTTAFVDWSNANAGSGIDIVTPDLSAIITELVTDYAYSNGALGLVWTTRAGSGTRDTSVLSYDGSTTNCARLYIQYSYTLTWGGITSMLLEGAAALLGEVAKSYHTLKTGTITQAGALARALSAVRSFVGSAASGGTVTKTIQRLLTGAGSPSGILTRVRAKLMTLAGSLLPFGPSQYTFSTGDTLTGSAGSSGLLGIARSAVRTFVGAVASSGAITRSYQTIKAAVLLTTGAFDYIMGLAHAFAGVMGSAGAMTFKLGRTVAGSITSGGVLRNALARLLAGNITPSGTMTTLRAIIETFVGAITPSGILARALTLNQLLTGAIDATGEMLKSIKRTLTGGVTSGGALAYLKAFAQFLAGAITPTGKIVRSFYRTRTGELTPAGVVVKNIYRVISGAVAQAGTLAKGAGKTLSGALAFVGTMTQSTVTIIVTGIIDLHLRSRARTLTMRVREIILTLKDR